MIKFFRKIRQKLLSENKFSKYLIYAVGEIVLVVIGILIALQINNWNEQRKIKKQETQVYKELKSDLLQTRYDILNVVSNNKAIVNSTTKLIEAISKKKPYNDSIYNHFLAFDTLHNWLQIDSILDQRHILRPNLEIYFPDLPHLYLVLTTNRCRLRSLDNWDFARNSKKRKKW